MSQFAERNGNNSLREAINRLGAAMVRHPLPYLEGHFPLDSADLFYVEGLSI